MSGSTFVGGMCMCVFECMLAIRIKLGYHVKERVSNYQDNI